ncbi:CapA family protein [Haloarchaeobius litoreus]|uniref:CapA family protein n=1 Tax=Haloarchaeobius litoreus TaxID=755306 RepID=A0ABD6DPC0_9EURY|nr:CapA family protein [Haloarchaeobius litoreus]
MAPRLGLTGDVMLGRNVDERQARRSVTTVWGDVLERLQSLDGLLVNLECCLSTRGTPWQRTRRAFRFRADPEWALPALDAAGVDCCALANNHVLDFEEEALLDTLDRLDETGIARAGAGRTRETAFAPATFDVDEVTVAIVSVTDNTPEYAATERTPGTAYVDIESDESGTREAVAAALGRARATDPDLLVTSLHWGPNMVTEPPDSFRRFAHWLVEQGVDVVHGHSAHVFQGIEVYEGRPILYDTGDFVDDYAVDDELRNDRSFLFEVALTPTGEPTSLRLRPTEIHDCAVHGAGPGVAAWARKRMRALSAPFGTDFERAGDGLVLEVGGTSP